MKAQAGRVSTQAATILPARPQRTAEKRLEAPTPMMVALITWVVLSGKPKREAT